MSGLVHAATETMLRAQRRLDIVAINIANGSTPGFKPVADVGSFAEAAARLRARVDQGKLEATGRPLDLAIAGDGLFRVRDGDRFLYTRQGSFALDGEGRVATPQGYVLQQAGGGDLELSRGAVTIAADGVVSEGDRPIARLALYAAPEGQAPAAIDGSLFIIADAEEVAAPHLRQGMLESSTVALGDEMVATMAALRQADAGGRVMQVWDDLMGRAVTTFGQAGR